MRTRPGEGHSRVRVAHAVERVRAAAEAARSLPHPFVLTARAENLIVRAAGSRRHHPAASGLPGSRRRRAFAPGVATSEDIAAVVRPSIARSTYGRHAGHDQSREMQELGVRSASAWAAPSPRAALGGFMRAAREMREQGTFTFVRDGVSHRDLAAAFHK